jgi:threonine/homoserine/homoserine lactone efflux protein
MIGENQAMILNDDGIGECREFIPDWLPRSISDSLRGDGQNPVTVMNLFLKGCVIGFSIAAPVGPIGILCIRRSLGQGWAAGFFSGLGAATADAIYGSIAAFGLTAVSHFLIEQQFWLNLAGGIFLCYLGVKTFLFEAGEISGEAKRSDLSAAYGSTLLLTLTNPATILSFVAVFAGLGLAQGEADYFGAAAMVLGVFLGSAAWWLILSSAAATLRSRFKVELMKLVNRFSGVILFGFGVYALTRLRP